MDREAFFARRMHTPDDPERARRREALREISRLLIPLHRGLIDAAKVEFAAATNAAIPPPTVLLQLLSDDPFFAWLKPITALIVDIDETARQDFEQADLDRIAASLDRFFGPTPDAAFASRYIPLLQSEVDVTIAHAALRKAISKLTARE